MDQPEDRGWLKKVFEQNKREFDELPSWLQRERPFHRDRDEEADSSAQRDHIVAMGDPRKD
jgi:hypothetical protein